MTLRTLSLRLARIIPIAVVFAVFMAAVAPARSQGVQLEFGEWRPGDVFTEQDTVWGRNHPNVADVIVSADGVSQPVLRIFGTKGILRTRQDTAGLGGPEMTFLLDFCLKEGHIDILLMGSHDMSAATGWAGFDSRENQDTGGLYLRSNDGVKMTDFPMGIERGQWYRLLVDYQFSSDNLHPPQAKVWLWAIRPEGLQELMGGQAMENGWPEGSYPVTFQGLGFGLPPRDVPGEVLVARAYLVPPDLLPTELREGGKNPLAPTE